MRHHPLTPMTDANLVRVLGRRTRSRVGLVDLAIVEAGPRAIARRFAELAGAGDGVAIVDALFDRHLDAVAEASAGLRLTSGGGLYASRPDDHAVVHLHSTYATALSCRSDLPAGDAVPPLTPYVIMRVGRVAVVPYSRPGDTSAGGAIRALAAHRAVLLANHGPVVAGRDLETAVSAPEELEETARLFFMLEGRPHRRLTAEQIDDVERVFGSR